MSADPLDIPSNPHVVYKDQGWQSMYDWLGTEITGRGGRKRNFRSYAEARNFVHTLKLKDSKEWWQYSKGALKGYERKPLDIPSVPHRTYKDQGWKGIRDWLGNEKIGRGFNFRSFGEARSFVHTLKLKNGTEWRQYSKGALKGYERKPLDIPSTPHRVYKDQGWQGMRDWLGTEITGRGGKKRNFRSFGEARSFVHTLKLKNQKEWRQYRKGTLKGYERRPIDIPSAPNVVYKDQGWQSMYDWLGTEITGRGGKKRNYRSFGEARSFVHTLKLKNSKEWRQYAKGALKGYERRPIDVPSSPNKMYKDQGWQGMRDWLGNEKIGRAFNYRSFGEARSFVHTLKLKNSIEWRQYSKGALKGYERRPIDIPSTPRSSYKDQGWQGMRDWLGNEKIGRAFNYRSFAEARSFVHTLKLKDTKEWLQYRKGTLKGYERRPIDIPSVPHGAYKDQGWQGMRDWLGSEKIGRGFNFRSFAEARSFVHTLKLKDTKEWLQYRKGTLKGYERRPIRYSE